MHSSEMLSIRNLVFGNRVRTSNILCARNQTVEGPMIRQSKIRRAIRNNSGSMLVLVGAILLGVLLALLFFALNYVRMLGAHEEQRTAIEAAALAAARDITNIVVEDPNCGLVSLSDVAPKGNNTRAGDNYDLPIQGINTLLATVRIDAIV